MAKDNWEIFIDSCVERGHKEMQEVQRGVQHYSYNVKTIQRQSK